MEVCNLLVVFQNKSPKQKKKKEQQKSWTRETSFKLPCLLFIFKSCHTLSMALEVSSGCPGFPLWEMVQIFYEHACHKQSFMLSAYEKSIK